MKYHAKFLAFNLQKSIVFLCLTQMLSGCAWQHALETSQRLDCTTGYFNPQVIAPADRTQVNCPSGDPRTWALYGKGGSQSSAVTTHRYTLPQGNFTVQTWPTQTVILPGSRP